MKCIGSLRGVLRARAGLIQPLSGCSIPALSGEDSPMKVCVLRDIKEQRYGKLSRPMVPMGDSSS